MTDLTPITAFGAQTPRRATYGAITLTEECDLGLASLALRKGQEAPTVFGISLPAVGKLAQSGGTSAFWSAPDQWMIMGAGHGNSDFATMVQTEAPNASVTEQTDGFATITVGAGAAQLERMLSKLVNLPLAAIGAGCATRTGLQHMTVFLVRPSETALHVLVPRSYAGSLWHALETAAHRANH